MENGVKLLNGDIRKNSVDDEPTVPVLVNGEGDVVEGEVEGEEGTKNPSGKTVKEDVPVDRVKRKAKRLTKILSKEVLNGSAPLPVSRYLKNSRKPRNGFGRGLPKKGK